MDEAFVMSLITKVKVLLAKLRNWQGLVMLSALALHFCPKRPQSGFCWAPRIMTFEQDKYLNMGRLLVFYYLSLVLVSQSIRFDRTPRITYIVLPFCYWPVSEVGILGGGQKDCWIVGSEDKNASTSTVWPKKFRNRKCHSPQVSWEQFLAKTKDSVILPILSMVTLLIHQQSIL